MASESPFPPLAAIYLTHFDDTKGQTVLYYKSANEDALPSGTIEHSSLPSGSHQTEEDLFGFRHGGYPAVGLFRSRPLAEGQGRGRGRRMATLGVVLSDEGAVDELFSLRIPLRELYDRIEAVEPSAFTRAGRAGLDKVLDGVWAKHGAKTLSSPSPSSAGTTTTTTTTDRLRDLVDTASSQAQAIPDEHPINSLPRLLHLLGPQITTIYKAALTGKRILIYSQPELLPVAAYPYCIAAMSLAPRAVDPPSKSTSIAEWLGQVGLMDLDALYARTGAWVAATSEKIILSHTKLFDLSLDLSTPTPEIRRTDDGALLDYAFADIPLYRTLQLIGGAQGSGARGPDWWMTLYDLMDRAWSLCTGVCEYAIGRGRVGGDISLPVSLEDQDGDEDEGAGLLREEGEQSMTQGQLMLRQLYHNTHHVFARLRQVRSRNPGDTGDEVTFEQVRELTGRWIVTREDARFWTALAKRWPAVDAAVDGGADVDTA